MTTPATPSGKRPANKANMDQPQEEFIEEKSMPSEGDLQRERQGLAQGTVLPPKANQKPED